MNKEELNKYMETKREIEIIEDKIEYLKEKKTSIKSMIIAQGGVSPQGRAAGQRFSQLHYTISGKKVHKN